MTVGELIELLDGLDTETKIVVYDDEWGETKENVDAYVGDELPPTLYIRFKS